MGDEVVIVTNDGEAESANDATEAAAEAVEAAAEAVEAAAEAVQQDDAPHHCDESCPCRTESRAAQEAAAAAGAAAAAAIDAANSADALARAAIAHLSEMTEEPVVEEESEIEPLPVPEDSTTDRKHNLLW